MELLNHSSASAAAAESPARRELPPMALFSREPITEATAQSVLEHTAIHGDPETDQPLTIDDLVAAGLAPKVCLQLQGREVWLSSGVYDLSHDRVAVMAYVRTEQSTDSQPQYVARSYYRSSSQGLWRYLPHYRRRQGETIHYDKGYSEFSITLPAELQEALAAMSTQAMPVLSVDQPDRIFTGTARNVLNAAESTYTREIPSLPQRLAGQLYRQATPTDPERCDHVPPQSLRLDKASQEPNYTQPLSTWQQYSPLYQGTITVEVYSSFDQQLRYLICKDKRGRCWVGGVEDPASPPTTTGLRQQWIDAGDLTTPAFEYASQAGPYGDPSLRQGDYVDMFSRYLRHVPLIKEYATRQAIADAASIAQLLDRLELIGGIQGSQQYYTDGDIATVIDQIRRNELTLQHLPSTYGLRQKVKQLLDEHQYL